MTEVTKAEVIGIDHIYIAVSDQRLIVPIDI